MKTYRAETIDLNEQKILSHLNTVRDEADMTSTEYQLAFNSVKTEKM